MTTESIHDVLAVTKALADGNRLRVLMALAQGAELCVCQITEFLNLAPATVSRHMSVLQAAGLVVSRKEGRWVIYGLSPQIPKDLAKWLESSLEHTREIDADRDRLMAILASDREELCRTQKSRLVAAHS